VALSADPPVYLHVTAESGGLSVTAYGADNEKIDFYTVGNTEPPDDEAWRISVIGPDKTVAASFTERDLSEPFAHAYSTVNNWPTSRFYAAEGYKVTDILAASGLFESAWTVTFRAEDGYEVSLTREQLLAPQYYFPEVGVSEDGAEEVYPVIAYRWREGTDDLSGLREEPPALIFGQRYPFEQTNPAFVENLSEIVVSDKPCATWETASSFPLPGVIASGETVKLQHPDYGLVKLHYTTDGSDPTPLSPIYNKSAYQPELNVPIRITGPTVIKVIARGYGRDDSDIAVLEFTPQD
jgi:hypothetical protein